MNTNNTQGSLESAYALEPRVYELGYHIISSVDEGNIEAEREALVAIITKFKGIVISEELPALINLAYSMDKIIKNKRSSYDQAYFGWIKFDLAPESIVAFEKEIEALPNILRFLIIKTVRENTIVSETPYKLAKNTKKSDADDDVERPVADEAPVSEETDETEGEAQPEVGETPETEEATETVEADDLTKIEGIGPKIAEIFAAAGVRTFEDLSSSKVGDLRTILEENKLSSHDPKTWSKQATLAKNGKWDKLAELQDELKGGK